MLLQWRTVPCFPPGCQDAVKQKSRRQSTGPSAPPDAADCPERYDWHGCSLRSPPCLLLPSPGVTDRSDPMVHFHGRFRPLCLTHSVKIGVALMLGLVIVVGCGGGSGNGGGAV